MIKKNWYSIDIFYIFKIILIQELQKDDKRIWIYIWIIKTKTNFQKLGSN